MSADRDQAAADLAALDRDWAALADRVVPPWWFAPALGLLLFGFLSAQAIEADWVTGPALLVFGVGPGLAVALLSRRWTRAWQRELREGV